MSAARPKRAVIYTRISKDAAGQSAGVRRQEAACRELVERNKWQTVEVLTDNDTSAYSSTPRPGYEALLQAIADRRVDLVVCWHTDRLYRRAKDLERYIDVCEQAGVPTHAVQSGPLDLTQPSGRMVARALGAVAAYEVEQKSERQRAANQARAAAGQVRKGGTRLFGYLPDMAGVVEEEAGLVAEAFENVATVKSSMYSIAKKWNALERYTPQARRRLPPEQQRAHEEALARWELEVDAAIEARQDPPERPRPPHVPSRWTGPKIKLLLANPRYAGMVTYRGQIVRSEDGKPLQGSWKPLVDMQTWQTVQGLLAASRPFPVAPRQLLAGVALCGVCGEPMVSGGTRNGRRRLRCGGHGGHAYRESESIEEFVVKAVLRRLAEPDAREVLAATPRGHERVDVLAINAELEELAVREQEIATAFADGAVSMAQLTAATSAIRAQREQLEQQLPAPDNAVVRQLIDAVDVRAVWDSLNQDHQREVIRILCRVEVLPARTKEHAYVNWRTRELNPETVRITWL